jgi:hypothetical protein
MIELERLFRLQKCRANRVQYLEKNRLSFGLFLD